jgi:hypothetical protein
MLNRFEHNLTVQNIVDRLPITTKTINNETSTTKQTSPSKNNTDLADPILTSKKFYDIIDDSLILDDVRLCINDMILFLTSQFYQTVLSSYTSILTNTTTTTTTTSQSSTPLSVSFHDLSLISSSTTTSLPTTPSTPHSRFHRSLTRFSSTVTQDHSFNTEHLLRLPNTLIRGTDSMLLNSFAPVLSTQPSLLAKKRRKNKNKVQQVSEQEQQVTDFQYNTNNNNNNMDESDEISFQMPHATFNVCLPEDCSDLIVIDEQNENNWINNVHRNFGIEINSTQ